MASTRYKLPLLKKTKRGWDAKRNNRRVPRTRAGSLVFVVFVGLGGSALAKVLGFAQRQQFCGGGEGWG